MSNLNVQDTQLIADRSRSGADAIIVACRGERAKGPSDWRARALQEARSGAVRVVRNEVERRALGRLRYEHFIARDKRSFLADHRARLFLEPIDDLSVNFFVPHGDAILAAVRLTPALDAGTDGQLSQVIRQSRLSFADLPIALVISRLVIRSEIRARWHLPGLFREVYRVGQASGARYCIMGCKPSLIALYKRLGFAPNGQSFVHPEAGEQHVAVFDTLGRDNAKGVNLRIFDWLQP